MRAGADVVYQACSPSDGWRGFADFLERRQPSDGAFCTRPSTRSSRGTRSRRTCSSSASTRTSSRGSRGAARADARRARHRARGGRSGPADFLAYYRRARARFVEAVDAGPETTRCRSTLRALRLHRSSARRAGTPTTTSALVARIRRDQIGGSSAPGSRRSRQLGDAPPATTRPARCRRDVRDAARPGRAPARGPPHGHARLRAARARGARAGSSCCRRPSPGDLFFDIEGDPFWEPGRGLEYLCGITDTRRRRFTRVLGARPRRGAASRSSASSTSSASASPRTRTCTSTTTPPTRPTALKRLAAEYGTREEELDELLRGEVFVDLYKVVAQALRISHPRYWLKKVASSSWTRPRPTCGRATTRSCSTSSWLAERDPAILDDDRALQRGGLRLDAAAARLAARAEGGGRGAVRRRDPVARAARAARAETRRRPSCARERAALREPLARDRRRGARAHGATCSTTTAARRSRSGGRSSRAAR